MPVVGFDGTITLVDDLSKLQAAIDELRRADVVGWIPKQNLLYAGTHHKVSLVQISTTNHCFLFRLNKISFPQELADFLADDKVMKIGLALRDDFNGLIRQRKFKPDNFVDLQTIVKTMASWSLAFKRFSPSSFLAVKYRKRSDSPTGKTMLTDQQQVYAATDAWQSLLIYLQLMKEKTY